MNKSVTTSQLHPRADREARKYDIITTAKIRRFEPAPRTPGKRYLDEEMITTNNLEKIQNKRAMIEPQNNRVTTKPQKKKTAKRKYTRKA